MRYIAPLLAMATMVAAHGPAPTSRGWNLMIGRLANLVGEAPIANIHFREEIIPGYYTMSSFFACALLVGFMFRRGILTSIFFGALAKAGLALLFVFVAIGADGPQRHSSTLARYSIFNWMPPLTNRGAVGGAFFAVGFWSVIALGCKVGTVLAWCNPDLSNDNMPGREGHGRAARPRQRTYKMADLGDYFGRCCTRVFGGCGKYNDDPLEMKDQLWAQQAFKTQNGTPSTRYIATDDQTRDANYQVSAGDEEWANGGFHTVSKLSRGADDNGIENIFTGLTGTEPLGWATMRDIIAILTMVFVATGPLRDLWSNPAWDWIGTASLVVVLVLVLIFYVPYTYGDTLDDYTLAFDDTTNAEYADPKHLVRREKMIGEVERRWANKLALLISPFIHIFLFHVSMSIYFSVQHANGAYGRIQWAVDAREARELDHQNRLGEYLAILITSAVLFIVAFAQYGYMLNYTSSPAATTSGP